MKLRYYLYLALIFCVACGGTQDIEPLDQTPTEDVAVEVESSEEVHGEDDHDEDDHHEDEDHSHDDSDHSHDGEVNLDYFFDGALVGEPSTVECVLSDGTQTMCYEITVAGAPANHEIGPFCPETTEATAETGGIWFDGNAVYDVDGEFILGLAELYNDDNWKLYNDDGTVKITDTEEAFDAAARPNVDPEYQNHCVEGQMEWLDNGEPVQTTVTIPITPVPADNTSAGGNWGVTLNGVTIAAAAPVDAILGAYTIAAFDDCGGHINPVDGYHLHGARGCSEIEEALDGDASIFAYAMDGYPIYSALSDEELATANLDECNGHESEELGYHYHANPAEENSVISCFKGLTVGGGDDRGPGGRGGDGERDQGQGGRPDFAAAAEELGVTEQELLDALGGPPPDFAAAAEALGVTVEAVESALNGATDTAAVEPPVQNAGDIQPSDYLGSYEYMNEEFGTMVTVIVDEAAGTRTITSNALPNHETGEFPNPGNPNVISVQDGFWEYPLEPTFVGTASFARTPGVAISGVKFEPDTAERVNCESGEVYNIEAIQDFTDLGLDFNNAHVQPTGEYHYHGVSELLVESFDGDSDLVHVAFAADGHLIFYSKSGAYQPSYQLGVGERPGTNCTYTLPGPSGGETLAISSEIDGTVKSDWVYDASYGDLDECNGTIIDGQYVYLVTDDYPYVPRCLMGEVAGGQGGPGGGGQGQGQGGEGGGRGQGGGRVDFAAAAETLGVTEQELRDALGGPPPDFAAAAEILGISEEELQEAIGDLPGGGRGNGGDGGGRGNGGGGGGG